MSSGERKEVINSDPEVIEEIEADEIGRVLEMVPAEARSQLVTVLRKVTQHSGPLPPPSMLAEYEKALPGLAERIVRMPEIEQKHRHAVVERTLNREIALKERGQYFAFAALLALLAFCGYLAFTGDTQSAAAAAIATVAAVVGVFVTGRYLDTRKSFDDPNNSDAD